MFMTFDVKEIEAEYEFAKLKERSIKHSFFEFNSFILT